MAVWYAYAAVLLYILEFQGEPSVPHHYGQYHHRPQDKGYFVGGKVKVIDIFNKRQKFLPEKNRVMYKDEEGQTVPALVSEELWEAANKVFQRRSIDVKHRRNCSTHKNTYTGKLFCAACGAPYDCKDVHCKSTDTGKWVCSRRIKTAPTSAPPCPSTRTS